MKAVTRIRSSPFPLYVRLLAEQVRHWRSDAGVPAVGSSVPSILNGLVDDLSRPANHAAARHGLTEDELIENLSADPLAAGRAQLGRDGPPSHGALGPAGYSQPRASGRSFP